MSLSVRFHASLILGLLASPAAGQIPGGSLLWLSADQSTLTPGQPVSSWVDLAHNRTATQPDPGLRPVLQQDAEGRRYLQLLWGQFFEAPPVFPVASDYTMVVVARLRDTSTVNNLVSGATRAYWFEYSSYPAVAHENRFQDKAFSNVPVQEGFNVMVLEYREKTGQAIHHINGLFGDSLWVGPNGDSTVLIGTYNKSYFTNIDLSEVLIYPRILSAVERTALEDRMIERYKINRPPPLPKPDSTFAEKPNRFQLYPRGSDDSATVAISGSLYAAGYDSIYTIMLKNGETIERLSKPLAYVSGSAPFHFSHRIHAELSEYSFRVHAVRSGVDSLMYAADSVVCGDAILIGGISNSTFGSWTWKNTNEFARTFGLNLSRNPRDTAWTISDVDPWGLGASVSGWGARVQQLIAERHNIPTVIINWGAAGTIIDHHVKKDTYPHDLSTFYGRLLYRLDKSGLRHAIRATYFWGGELDQFDGHEEKLRTLLAQLKEDIPSIQKTYMLQMRPSYCANLNSEHIRDLQRRLQDSLPNLETLSPTPWSHYDGCHFDDQGQLLVGEKLYLPLARDFYGITDTNGLRAPSLHRVYYTDSNHDQIALEFLPSSTTIYLGQDTTVLGVDASLVDYIYLDSTSGKIQSATAVGNRVILKLKQPYLASRISYVPDRYYHNTEIIYQGPWIASERGFGALAFHNAPVHLQRGVDRSSTDISLLPNPCTDGTTLIMPSGQAATMLVVHNVHGVEVKRSTIDPSSEQRLHRLNSADLPSGMYSIHLRDGTTYHQLRLVVVR